MTLLSINRHSQQHKIKAELCEMLMKESESDKAKAEALFLLCVWFEAVEAELLQFGGSCR